MNMPLTDTSPPALTEFRPALRRLLESHLPLQPRLRALLSRRRRHASGRHGELRRSERARHRGLLQGHRRIAAFAPECLTILTGGEPLLRRDILEIVRRAAERGLWVVVGTNGVFITENVARRLAEAGARDCRFPSMRSIPIVTTASGRCVAPGETRWTERRS